MKTPQGQIDVAITSMEEFGKILNSFPDFCSTFLKIKNKQGQIVPLNFNTPQKIIWNKIEPLILSGEPIRVIILKARQEGVSTLIEALIFWLTYITSNHKACIIGHESKSSSNLFEMFKRFYNYLPAFIKYELKKSNAKILEYSKTGSSMEVLTAEGREGVARSNTLQIIHATEVAFYPDAEAVMTAMLQSLTDEGHYFEESTANGASGRFYDDWQSAVAGENDMIPIFLAWFELPEYSSEFKSEQEKQRLIETLTETEKSLIENYKVTYEQLKWRRNTIRFKCFNDENVFKQEYPSDDVEAFLVSGRPVFDTEICNFNYKLYKNFVPQRFRLEYVYENGNVVGVQSYDDAYGNWYMFEEVDVEDCDNYRFAVGTDVAEGLEQGDYSAMEVLDRKTMKFPIKYHGHIDPDLLAEEQHKLHLYLNKKAYFCTERNNHGLTTISVAYRLKVKQYYQTNYMKGYEIDTNSLGFKTTMLTKPMIINDLNQAIRENAFVDEDKNFWKEAITFVRNATGQMTAQGKDKSPNTKCYDDRVMAKALAIVCHKWQPNYTGLMHRPVVDYNRIKTVTNF